MTEEIKIFTMDELSQLHGPLDIPMTNDYLFRALLQQNNQVLKAMICSLLHLDPDQIKEVTVENPIELGKSYGDKEFILDIKALLDGNLITNLEMQVINEHNWQNRSLHYLCRSFDQLNKGDLFLMARPVVQIGFLNFSLFGENPEFYATYYMMNEKTYQKYSDKLRLAVVDLTQIALATREDREYGIDQWARFFKCKDWSELVMLAKENADIQAAVGTVYQLSKEEKIRQQCEAREDFYKREMERQLREQWRVEAEKRLEENQKQFEEDQKQFEEDQKQFEEDQKQFEEDQKQFEEDQKQFEEDQKQLVEDQKRIAENQKLLEEKEKQLAERERKLTEKERMLKRE